jgi:hypothetical protein
MKMKLFGLVAPFVMGVVAFAGLSEAQASTLVSSTFDTSLDGWTSTTTPSQIAWQSTGGNPGGYVQFTDTTADSTAIQAPSKFLGNYITTGVAAISFDHNIFSAPNQAEPVVPYQLAIFGPGGSARWVGSTPSIATLPTGWVTLSASISDAGPTSGWTLLSGDWAALLADVTSLTVQIELVNGADVDGVDNVILSGGATPLPATLPLFATGLGAMGLLGWRRKRKATALAVA